MYNPIYFVQQTPQNKNIVLTNPTDFEMVLILWLLTPYYTRMVAILFYLTVYEQRLILVCLYGYNTEKPELLSEILQVCRIC
jgi:hypothetical protein